MCCESHPNIFLILKFCKKISWVLPFLMQNFYKYIQATLIFVMKSTTLNNVLNITGSFSSFLKNQGDLQISLINI